MNRQGTLVRGHCDPFGPHMCEESFGQLRVLNHEYVVNRLSLCSDGYSPHSQTHSLQVKQRYHSCCAQVQY